MKRGNRRSRRLVPAVDGPSEDHRGASEIDGRHTISRAPLTTPDGRYIVVRGRLWRKANPHLPEAERQRQVGNLMDARRSVAAARRVGRDETAAHAAVNAAKMALGERGPVWWTDGAPDLNRHMARNTCYAAWFAGVEES